jgi:3-oxoacyl-[acyl-carrier protein] reductase
VSSLTGAVAVVTGASRGIGAAIAKRLAADGASVALMGRDLPQLEQVRATLPQTCKSVSVPCDLRSSDQIKDAVSKVVGSLGEPTILVNNAGMTGPFHWIDEVSDDEWETIFFTNVRAAFLLSKRLLPMMKRAGHGRIVNIASIQAHIAMARSSTYIASKYALVGYTKAIAAEWGRWGITCNAVSPGYAETTTGLHPGSIESHRRFVRTRIPAGRMGSPEDVANYVAFLSSREAGYVNGTTAVVDGGLLADLGFQADEE